MTANARSGEDASQSRRVQQDSATAIKLVRHGSKYRLVHQLRRRNDLMFFVGFLDFFNALDFPANIWNEIPTPTYAKALMVTGGTLCILATLVAFWDLRRSWRNIRVLWQERIFLRAMLDCKEEPSTSTTTRHHIGAWLSVNFRELGWEVMDRALMDALVGFAGILVGVGTVMAIGGANRHVFDASNLLSGYIGNGFIALYGVLNAAWAVYLWKRARRNSLLVKRALRENVMRKRAGVVFFRHELWASLNGINLLVSAVGSLVSSTRWWGYIILVPCVFISVFCNAFWRHKLGYSRLVFPHRSLNTLDIQRQIASAIAAQEWLRTDSHSAEYPPQSIAALLACTIENEMLPDLCLGVVNSARVLVRGRLEGRSRNAIVIDRATLEGLDYTLLLRYFKRCAVKISFTRALDRERLSYDLLGAYLANIQDAREEKSTLQGRDIRRACQQMNMEVKEIVQSTDRSNTTSGSLRESTGTPDEIEMRESEGG